MNIFTGIILYILIWWTTLFAVLPWGARRPENHEVGHVASAPANPHLRIKFLATTGVAAAIWLLAFTLIKMDIIDFRAISTAMMMKGMQP